VSFSLMFVTIQTLNSEAVSFKIYDFIALVHSTKT